MTRQCDRECAQDRVKESGRLRRERRTIRVMIELYCRGQHRSPDGLCAECQQLSGYAMQRLDKCPYQERKPTCAQCPIHCYKPEMRRQVRQVMRYAGPRMLLAHPFLTLHHYADEVWHSARSGLLAKVIGD